jgi:hypothetical protein
VASCVLQEGKQKSQKWLALLPPFLIAAKLIASSWSADLELCLILVRIGGVNRAVFAASVIVA